MKKSLPPLRAMAFAGGTALVSALGGGCAINAQGNGFNQVDISPGIGPLLAPTYADRHALKPTPWCLALAQDLMPNPDCAILKEMPAPGFSAYPLVHNYREMVVNLGFSSVNLDKLVGGDHPKAGAWDKLPGAKKKAYMRGMLEDGFYDRTEHATPQQRDDLRHEFCLDYRMINEHLPDSDDGFPVNGEPVVDDYKACARLPHTTLRADEDRDY